MVHYDVWGPCPVTSPTWFKYFVTFVDDFSHVTWLYLMKSRFEPFYHFSAFYAEIQTQFHVSVQTLRNDNAKEYLSIPFSLSCYNMRFSIRLLVLILLLRVG